MDSSQSQPKKPSFSSSTSCRRCRLKIPVSRKAQFYATYCRQQPFAFPDSIMHYIAKNPTSAKVYAKLVKTCKYFYAKNPIILLPNLCCNDDGEWYTFWSYSGGMHGLNLSNLSCKFWVNDEFCIHSNMVPDESLCSSVIPKIYKCDVQSLTFRKQNITFDEFKFLTTNVEELDFIDVAIKNEDGSIVPLEILIEAVPTLKKIYYFDNPDATTVSSKTFTELLKIPHFLALDYCKFALFPETFDIEAYYTYMKKNQHTLFLLGFNYSLSDGYKRRIETIIDEVLAYEYDDYKLPWLFFPGLDEIKYNEIAEAFNNQ